MKNLVKISFVVAFFAAIGFSANAQTSNSTITVGAKVFDQITVEAGDNLELGGVMKGTFKKVDITGGITGTNEAVGGSGVQVGTFKVFAGAGSDVTLTFAPIANLTSGENNLPIVFTEEGTDMVGYSTGDASTAVRFSGLEAIVGEGVGSAPNVFPTNPIGTRNGITVFVGAKVEAGAAQASGTYTGTVKLTATYN
ncbi:hypothetical protein [Cognataquiflexum rubidum]|uniref:hypothetical protein n=1 Tax=Cognataquiflexum rubidum TaxID=2922273 RepID=UPI001F145DD5|nr:hypothetical protein [Cognataquiflexum rubidum]MCH6232816.1 hypothetical protein [Cognataquiflexum rubidum]